MIVSLPQERVNKIREQCKALQERPTANSQGSDKSDRPIVIDSNRSLTSSSSISVARKGRFEERIKLSPQAKAELNWWVQNLELSNGRSLVSIPAQLIISSDASMTGWGAFCQNQSAVGPWSIIERKCHINVLELRAVKLAIMIFTVNKKIQSIHMRMDNMAALKYLVKMGGTYSKEMVDLSKEIWGYLLQKQITLTAEYLPGIMNVEADRESHRATDSSEWKLNPIIFQKVCCLRGTPEKDLFASRVSKQLQRYMTWKLDPYSQGRDAFLISWNPIFAYAFPSFSVIGRVLKKVLVDQAEMIVIIPAWQTQAWYPRMLELSVQNPILIPQQMDLLTDPAGNRHPLVLNKSLRLVAWTVSGKAWRQREYKKKLPPLLSVPGDQDRFQITNRPGESGLAGVVRNKWIPLDVM